MTELARAEVVLEGRTGDFERAMRRAEGRMGTTGVALGNIAAQAASRIARSLEQVGRSVFRAAVNFDGLKRSLEVTAGSAEVAADQLRTMEQIAKLPGLGFQEAIRGASQLNVAFASLPNTVDRTNRTLAEFGNAIALTGGGKAELDRVILQLGQIASAGKVLTQDLRPIIQTAPAVAQALRDAFGTISPQEINNLGLSSQEFFDVLQTSLQKLPRASVSARTGIENLRDALFRASATVGTALLPQILEITAKIEGFANAVTNNEAQVRAFAAVAVAGFNQVLQVILVPLRALRHFGETIGLVGAAVVGLATGDMALLSTAISDLNTHFENFGSDVFDPLIFSSVALNDAARAAVDAMETFGGVSEAAVPQITQVDEQLGRVGQGFRALAVHALAADQSFRLLADTAPPTINAMALSAQAADLYALALDRAVQAADRLAEAQRKLSGVTGILGSLSRIPGLGALGGLLGPLGIAGGLLSGFQGFRAHGGSVSAGGWAIAGEAGRPEIVTGPATVTPLDGVTFAPVYPPAMSVTDHVRDPLISRAWEASLRHFFESGGRVPA